MTKKTTTTTVAETEFKDEETAAPQSPDINLQDLQMMKQIIELCSSRSAFKPSEMAAVGTVYNKLDTFLQAVAEQQKQTTQPNQTNQSKE
jgi:hypothetical protein